jgi:hypothetical protein
MDRDLGDRKIPLQEFMAQRRALVVGGFAGLLALLGVDTAISAVAGYKVGADSSNTDALQTKVGALEKDKNNLVGEKNGLQSQITDCVTQTTDLQDQLAMVTAERDDLSAQVGGRDVLLEQYKKEKETIDAEIVSDKTTIQALTDENVALKTQIEQLTATQENPAHQKLVDLENELSYDGVVIESGNTVTRYGRRFWLDGVSDDGCWLNVRFTAGCLPGEEPKDGGDNGGGVPPKDGIPVPPPEQ